MGVAHAHRPRCGTPRTGPPPARQRQGKAGARRRAGERADGRKQVSTCEPPHRRRGGARERTLLYSTVASSACTTTRGSALSASYTDSSGAASLPSSRIAASVDGRTRENTSSCRFRNSRVGGEGVKDSSRTDAAGAGAEATAAAATTPAMATHGVCVPRADRAGGQDIDCLDLGDGCAGVQRAPNVLELRVLRDPPVQRLWETANDKRDGSPQHAPAQAHRGCGAARGRRSHRKFERGNKQANAGLFAGNF